MTKVSASTLVRRAAKTKNKAEAKRLRAQAAKLRREEREANKFQSSTIAELDNRELGKVVRAGRRARKKPRPAEKIIKGLNQALDQVRHEMEWRPLAAGDTVMMSHEEAANDERPGHGEIVGGKLAQKAEEIAKLARQKGGVDAIQHMLTQIESLARYEAQRRAEERFTTERIEIGQAHRDRIVCAFLAKVETLEMMRNGIPNAGIIDGLTIAKLADALHAAGYTAHGKR